MSRDERLTTKAQREQFLSYRQREAMRGPAPSEPGTAYSPMWVGRLYDDIEARIERERKLREALRRIVGPRGSVIQEEALVGHIHGLLAETADDE